jgi:hypothetical protein
MRPVERARQCKHACVVGQVTRTVTLVNEDIYDSSVVTLYEGDSITLFNFCPCCGQELELIYTVEDNRFYIRKDT